MSRARQLRFGAWMAARSLETTSPGPLAVFMSFEGPSKSENHVPGPVGCVSELRRPLKVRKPRPRAHPSAVFLSSGGCSSVSTRRAAGVLRIGTIRYVQPALSWNCSHMQSQSGQGLAARQSFLVKCRRETRLI